MAVAVDTERLTFAECLARLRANTSALNEGRIGRTEHANAVVQIIAARYGDAPNPQQRLAREIFGHALDRRTSTASGNRFPAAE